MHAFIAGWNASPQIHDDLQQICKELEAIGKNLNQAQKLANRYRRPTKDLRVQVGTTARVVAKLITKLEQAQV
ncbi:MAG: hypothetical protein MJE77_08560 [Proteobacteria bacterium]|nr:hypothetical protein [Pseudomonadota bacterium]